MFVFDIYQTQNKMSSFAEASTTASTLNNGGTHFRSESVRLASPPARVHLRSRHTDQDTRCFHNDYTQHLFFGWKEFVYRTKSINRLEEKEKKGIFLPGSPSIWTTSLVLELSTRLVLEGATKG